MSITAVCFFRENNLVERKTEKLISHPQKVTSAHAYAPEFLCVQETKMWTNSSEKLV